MMNMAREEAAQCWCDPETSHLTMVPELAEAVAKRICLWMEMSARQSENAGFYAGLLDKCAENLGPLAEQAYISDDGSVQDEPLALKIPELVAELAKSATTTEFVEYAVGSVVQGLLGASISIVSRISGRPEGPELQNSIIDALGNLRAPGVQEMDQEQLDAAFAYMVEMGKPIEG